MSGYGAVVSLQLTIERLLECSRFRLVSSSRKMLRYASTKLGSLQEILERLDCVSPIKSRKKVNALDGRIKEAVWRFEDALEHQILSQLESSGGKIPINLQSLRHDVVSLRETVKDMEKKFLYELDNMPELDEEESAVSSSRSDFDGMKAKMAGFSQEFKSAKNRLMQEGDGNYVYSVLGMPGSGKTALAENVFEDSQVLEWFDHRVWVRVGRKNQFNEIGRCILAQVDPKMSITEEGDAKIIDCLKENLRGKRCLVVLDDVWDTQQLDYFISCLPNNYKNNACIRILVTTNLSNIPTHISTSIGFGCTLPMRPLNEEQSKDVLLEKVFGEEDFPPQLEKAAKKIAKNCNGLPLMIVTVADLLLKSNKIDDQDYWNEVADNRRSAVMMDAHHQISKVLFPVYDCSPQSFKMLYLYMGAFPQDNQDIPAPKLINMLTAEGFIQRQTLDQILEEFCRMSNVVVSGKRSMRNNWAIKTCRLNPSWCYLLNKEASQHKFLRVLYSSDFEDLEENIKGQRRLCLHANFVLNFREVYNSVKRDCANTARSLLCFGPFHQYPMPLDIGFKLLRVLDALNVRFYNFPIEILELAFLQTLTLTYNGKLPTSISKLLSLQFLIIHPHTSIIKSSEAPSYVPVEIWDMEDLKHIEIPGSNLQNPKYVVSLQKLSTLVGVSVNTCTRKVVMKLPNLRKLGIQIELTPESGGRNQLNCFDIPLEKLKNLETLECSVVNPEVKFGIGAPLCLLSVIPSGLRELHLSGLGYLWEDMKLIGSMPYLHVLKLRCYAFRGPKWETETGSFLGLRFLIIEDTDLVQWEPGRESFPKLYKVSFKHCYKLRELQWPHAAGGGRIKLLNCNPLGVTCAKQLKPTDNYSSLAVVASFDDEELSILAAN